MYEKNFENKKGDGIVASMKELQNFKEFQQMLQVMTFEGIMKLWEMPMVECSGNVSYVDSVFEDFLYDMENQGIEIYCEYDKKRIRFMNQDNMVSVVLLEERPNRFDKELPDEIVVLWNTLCERPILFTDLMHEDETLASYVLTGAYHNFHCVITKDSTDIAGALEDTLHRLLDAGCSDEDIYFHMGAKKPTEEEMKELEEYNEYCDIDLGYVLPGLLACFDELHDESDYKEPLFKSEVSKK